MIITDSNRLFSFRTAYFITPYSIYHGLGGPGGLGGLGGNHGPGGLGGNNHQNQNGGKTCLLTNGSPSMNISF